MAIELSIHQRVAERIETAVWEFDDCTDEEKVAAILAEEYGPLIEAAKEDVACDMQKTQQALGDELSKKGMI